MVYYYWVIIMNLLEQIKDIGKQIGVILLYLILTIILVLLLNPLLTSKNVLYQEISNILVYLTLLLCFIFLFRKIIVPNFYDFTKNGKNYIKDTYKYYLYGLVIMVISNIIIGVFQGLPANEVANRNDFLELPVSSILSFIIFAPITEELMTRVILKDTFKNKWIYIILSGFIFGFLHIAFSLTDSLWEILFIIPYGALGSALAYIYYKSNNVWTNIFYHSLHNLLCILLLLL